MNDTQPSPSPSPAPPPASKPISQAAIARALKVSKAHITGLKKEGCPVDSVASVRAWTAAKGRGIGTRSVTTQREVSEAMADCSKRTAKRLGNGRNNPDIDGMQQRAIFQEMLAFETLETAYNNPTPEIIATIPGLQNNYAKAQAMRLKTEADLLKHLEATGEVIPKADVKKKLVRVMTPTLSLLKQLGQEVADLFPDDQRQEVVAKVNAKIAHGLKTVEKEYREWTEA